MDSLKQASITKDLLPVRIAAPAGRGKHTLEWSIQPSRRLVDLPFCEPIQSQRQVGWKAQPSRILVDLDAMPSSLMRTPLYKLPQLAWTLRSLALFLQKNVCTKCSAPFRHSTPDDLVTLINSLHEATGVICFAITVDGDTLPEKIQRAQLYDRDFVLLNGYLLRSTNTSAFSDAPSTSSLAVVLITHDLSTLKNSLSSITTLFESLPPSNIDVFLISDRDKEACKISSLYLAITCSKCGASILTLQDDEPNSDLMQAIELAGIPLPSWFGVPIGKFFERLKLISKVDPQHKLLMDFLALLISLDLAQLHLSSSINELSFSQLLRVSLATLLTSPLKNTLILSRNWRALFGVKYDQLLHKYLDSNQDIFIGFTAPKINLEKIGLLDNSSPLSSKISFKIKVSSEESEIEIVPSAVNILNATFNLREIEFSLKKMPNIASGRAKKIEAQASQPKTPNSPFRQILSSHSENISQQSTLTDFVGLGEMKESSVEKIEILSFLQRFGFESEQLKWPLYSFLPPAVERIFLVKCLQNCTQRLGARRKLAKKGRLILLQQPVLGCSSGAFSALREALDILIQHRDTLVIIDSSQLLSRCVAAHVIL